MKDKAKGLLARSRGRRRFRPEFARAVRQGAHLSQAEMGQAIDAHDSTIAKWESGDRTPRGKLADRYFDLLTQLETELRRD